MNVTKRSGWKLALQENKTTQMSSKESLCIYIVWRFCANTITTFQKVLTWCNTRMVCNKEIRCKYKRKLQVSEEIHKVQSNLERDWLLCNRIAAKQSDCSNRRRKMKNRCGMIVIAHWQLVLKISNLTVEWCFFVLSCLLFSDNMQISCFLRFYRSL